MVGSLLLLPIGKLDVAAEDEFESVEPKPEFHKESPTATAASPSTEPSPPVPVDSLKLSVVVILAAMELEMEEKADDSEDCVEVDRKESKKSGFSIFLLGTILDFL